MTHDGSHRPTGKTRDPTPAAVEHSALWNTCFISAVIHLYPTHITQMDNKHWSASATTACVSGSIYRNYAQWTWTVRTGFIVVEVSMLTDCLTDWLTDWYHQPQGRHLYLFRLIIKSKKTAKGLDNICPIFSFYILSLQGHDQNNCLQSL